MQLSSKAAYDQRMCRAFDRDLFGITWEALLAVASALKATDNGMNRTPQETLSSLREF